MAFREVPVFEVREMLRLWMDGRGLRSIADVITPDRKAIRRIVDIAVRLGLDRDGGIGKLGDVFVSSVMTRFEVVRPNRHGETWSAIAGEHDRISGWVDTKDPVVKTCNRRRAAVRSRPHRIRTNTDPLGCRRHGNRRYRFGVLGADVQQQVERYRFTPETLGAIDRVRP